MADHEQGARLFRAARRDRGEVAGLLPGGEKDQPLGIGADPADDRHQARLGRRQHRPGCVIEPFRADAESGGILLGPPVGEGRVAVLIGAVGVAVPAEGVRRRGGGVKALGDAGLTQAHEAFVHGRSPR